MRENAASKARRLLVEGRLVVYNVDAEQIRARVRGDSGELHDCGYDARGWWCSCPAVRRCAHVRALQLVVLVRRSGHAS